MRKAHGVWMRTQRWNDGEDAAPCLENILWLRQEKCMLGYIVSKTYLACIKTPSWQQTWRSGAAFAALGPGRLMQMMDPRVLPESQRRGDLGPKLCLILKFHWWPNISVGGAILLNKNCSACWGVTRRAAPSRVSRSPESAQLSSY